VLWIGIVLMAILISDPTFHIATIYSQAGTLHSLEPTYRVVKMRKVENHLKNCPWGNQVKKTSAAKLSKQP
jgi:hypothetical protein